MLALILFVPSVCGSFRRILGFCVPSQTVQDGRQFMKYIDPHLGVPLPERDYGGNCLIYDPGNGTDPFHNIWVRSKLSNEAILGLKSCLIGLFRVQL